MTATARGLILLALALLVVWVAVFAPVLAEYIELSR